MTDPWSVDTLDLDAYLARTDAAAEPPSLAALARLQAAHVRTFPFDNLSVLLGTHPGVDLAAVQDKFLVRGRGGYCFEHSTLFAAVLARLGYAVTRHLGRVGDAQQAPRTHLVVVVDLDGEKWLCDTGFGRCPLGPIPLRDGAEESGGGWRHGIRRVDEGAGSAWELRRWSDGGWEHMHTTDELPVRPVDVAMGHHFTSTGPTSHFRSTLMCVRHGLDGDGTPNLTAVSLDGISVRRPGRPTEHRPLDVDELPGELDRLGAGLTTAEAREIRDLAAGMLRS